MTLSSLPPIFYVAHYSCPAFNYFMLFNLSGISELLFIKHHLPKNVLMTPLTTTTITYVWTIGGEMFEMVSLIDLMSVY
jgi:hypothetical protein